MRFWHVGGEATGAMKNQVLGAEGPPAQHFSSKVTRVPHPRSPKFRNSAIPEFRQLYFGALVTKPKKAKKRGGTCGVRPPRRGMFLLKWPKVHTLRRRNFEIP